MSEGRLVSVMAVCDEAECERSLSRAVAPGDTEGVLARVLVVAAHIACWYVWLLPTASGDVVRYACPEHAPIARVRDIIASLPQAKRCSPTCRTWRVERGEEGYRLEPCGGCWNARPEGAPRLTLAELVLLPEAATELDVRRSFDAMVAGLAVKGAA